MLEQIKICGHNGFMQRSKLSSAQVLLESEPQQWYALVICDSQCPIPRFVESTAKDYFRLEFDDVCSSQLGLAPNSTIIEDGLHWAKDKEKLMVACHAGISRSSAMALVIATEAWGLDKAFALLSPREHYPNKLVIRIGASLIGMPELWDRFAIWLEKATGSRWRGGYDFEI